MAEDYSDLIESENDDYADLIASESETPDTGLMAQDLAATAKVSDPIESKRSLLNRMRGVTGGLSDMAASGMEAILQLPEQYRKSRDKYEQELAADPIAAMNRPQESNLDRTLNALAGTYNQQMKQRGAEAERYQKDEPLASVANQMTGFMFGPEALASNAAGSAIAKTIPMASKIPRLMSKVVEPGLQSGINQVVSAETSSMPGQEVSIPKEFASGFASGAIGQQFDETLTPYAKLAAGKTMQGLGKAAQVPVNIYDKVAQKVGKVINEAFPSVAESFAAKGATGSSKLINKFKDVVALSVENASRGYNVGLKTLGDLKNKDILKIWENPEERQVLMQALQDTYRYRGQDAYMVDMAKLEDITGNALTNNRTIGNQSAGDFIKSVIKDTAEQRIKTSQNLFKDDPNYDYRALTNAQRKFLDMTDDLLSQIEKSEIGKNLGMPDEGRIGEYASGNIRIPLEKAEKAMVTEILPSSGEKISMSAAKEALGNITTGRNLMRLGGASSSVFLGPLGITPLAAESLGYAGMALEKSGAKVTQNAYNVINNPQMMQQLASGNDSVGEVTRAMIKDLQSGNQKSAASKSFLLAMNPEFRRLFSGKEQDKQALP